MRLPPAGVGEDFLVEVRVGHLEATTLRGRPDADDGIRGVGCRDRSPVPGDLSLGDLHDDGLDVVAGDVVLAATGVARAVAEVDRVEGGAEVDEERIVALAGEHASAARHGPDRAGGDGRVVGHRLGADVARRHGQSACDARRPEDPATPHRLADDVVALGDVHVRVVDRRDLRERREERVGIADAGPEGEAIANVGVTVARVVDVDVVPGPVVEAIEVRTAGGILERMPVGHDGQRIRRIARRERVDVGVVGGRIHRDVRRFAVARADAERNRYGARRHCGGHGQSLLHFGALPLLTRLNSTARPSCICGNLLPAGKRSGADFRRGLVQRLAGLSEC